MQGGRGRGLVDRLLLRRLRPAHADAEHVDARIRALEPAHQPGLGPGAAGADDHAVDPQIPLVRLLQELEAGVDVAERADRVRAAARDDVGPAAAPAHRLRDLGAGGVHVGAGRDEVQPRPEQPVEQDVAGRLVLGPVPGDPALEQGLAAQAEAAGGSRGLADVVRLHGAVGDQGVGAQPERVADQELELAGLVAAGRKPGAVVALDEQRRSAEQPGEIGHRLERGRQMGEADAGEAGEMHGRFPEPSVLAARPRGTAARALREARTVDLSSFRARGFSPRSTQLTEWQGCCAIVGGRDDQRSGPPMPSPSNPAHLRGGIGLRFIVPVAFLMLGALALVGGLLWVGSLKQDELGLSHQRQLVEHAVRSRLSDLSITAKDYSWWDDAVRYLVREFDPDWADGNPGIYVLEMFGYDYSFVIDGADRTLYAAIDGERASADAFATLSPDLREPGRGGTPGAAGRAAGGGGPAAWHGRRGAGRRQRGAAAGGLRARAAARPAQRPGARPAARRALPARGGGRLSDSRPAVAARARRRRRPQPCR